MLHFFLIIAQSPYFASMLSGNWKESESEVIRINVEGADMTSNCKFNFEKGRGVLIIPTYKKK